MNTVARGALMTLGVLLASACAAAPAASSHRSEAAVVSVASPSSPAPVASPAAPRPATGQTAGGARKPGTSSSTAPNLPGYPQYAPGSTPAPATATLSSECVTPGGTETLTIVTSPDFVIGFDAQYADGKDGRSYGGIDSNGRSGPDGRYSNTWVVGPSAPAGQAVVWIAIGSGGSETAFRQPTFRVEPSC